MEKACQTQQEARAGIQSQGLKDVFSSQGHVGEKGKSGGGWEARGRAGVGSHFAVGGGRNRGAFRSSVWLP